MTVVELAPHRQPGQRRRGHPAPAAPGPRRRGPARRRPRRPGPHRAHQLVHHLQPGGAVQQRPGRHDPGPGRGHPGRGRPAQPRPGPGPPADRAVLELADQGAARQPRPVLLHPDPGGAEHRAAAAGRPVDRGARRDPGRHHRRQRRDGRGRPPGRLVRPRGHRGVLGRVHAAGVRGRHHPGGRCSRSRRTCCPPTATSGPAPASRSGWSTSSCPAWRSAWRSPRTSPGSCAPPWSRCSSRTTSSGPGSAACPTAASCSGTRCATRRARR